MSGSSSFQNEKQRIIKSLIMPAIARIVLLPDEKSENLYNHLETKGRYHFYPENTIIEHPGGFDQSYAWFVERGFVRNYIYDLETGTETTTHLWKRRDVIMSSDCYIEKNQRIHHSAMLEDGYVFSLQYKDIEQILFEIPELQAILNLLHSERERMHDRHVEWLRLNTLGMVKELLAHYPGIERTNKKHLASYLNRTRTNLSKTIAMYKRDKN